MTHNRPSPTSLNAELNLWGPNGEIQFDKDKEAAREYFLQEVNPNTVFFHGQKERLEYLFDEGYYDKATFAQYSDEFLTQIYDQAYSYRFRFKTYVGALKFYRSYALKTFDGQRYLERFEDRVVATALTLARGDERLASNLVELIIKGAYQPATPTFLNAGRADAGEMVSCFLLDTQDSLESIMETISAAAQLSKRGGGVAVNLSNLRAAGDPIKGVEGASSGVVPYAKVLDDTSRWINQLGQRQGAFAGWIHAHHYDVLDVLDTKRENADESIRLKTFSLGVVIPDITYQLAAKGEDMYLFSPYDVSKKLGKEFSDVDITEHYRELVEDPNIRKKRIDARKFFQTLAELRYESGYPYIMNVDTVNEASKVDGKIKMSNLCSEILQPQTPSVIDKNGIWHEIGKDISCNLGSMNVARAMETGNLPKVVDTAIRSLSAVAEMTDIAVVPTIKKANDLNRSVGLGQMNLHGFFGKERMHYGDPDSIEFTSAYFSTVYFYALMTSKDLAVEKGSVFDGFEKSGFADGTALSKYMTTDYRPKSDKVRDIFAKYGVDVPGPAEWAKLSEDIKNCGLYNSHLIAVAPTGSISYVSHSTSSIMPIPAKIEIRKEGHLGRVYAPAPEMDNTNTEFFEDAYEIGWQRIIDVYSAATEHVDQGLSLNLFFPHTSMKEAVRSIMYAHKKGIKTLYYQRVRQAALDGVQASECVSCAV